MEILGRKFGELCAIHALATYSCLLWSIAKGNRIVIPLMGMNQWGSLWGNDALEFK